MDDATEPRLAKARRVLAEAEHAVRQEQTQLAEIHARDQQLALEARRVHATMQQADDRAAIRAAQERVAALATQRADLAKDIAAQDLVIERRKAIVAAAAMAINDVRNEAVRLRLGIARDQVEARQLEHDIAKWEADVDGWRRALAQLQRRIEGASGRLRELET
jgi:chromosome segregation ATPase